MKFVKGLAVALCAVALSVILAGCGNKAAGTHDLYEIQGDNGSSHEEIAELEKSSFCLYINLNEDGTFDLAMLGMDYKGTWKLDGQTVTMTPKEKNLKMTDCTLVEDKLTMNLLGGVTVFAKGSPKKVERK